MVGFLSWPLVASLVGPAYRRSKARFTKVARLSDLPDESPVRVSFTYLSEEAYIRELQRRDLWVIKHSDSKVTVFSPICTHLACRYDWDHQSEHFVCPCHGSVFAKDGTVLAGPAPRPLDTLPAQIEDGELLVEWQVFASGITQKEPL